MQHDEDYFMMTSSTRRNIHRRLPLLQQPMSILTTILLTILAVLAVVDLTDAFTATTKTNIQRHSSISPTTSYIRPHQQLQRSVRPSTFQLYMSDEPSDTSSDSYYDNDDVVTVESEDFIPTDIEQLVTNIMDLIPNTLGGQASEGKRSAVNEVLLKLESLNPTKQPALSPLLNGVWELKYAGLYTTDGSVLPFSPTRQLALFLYSGGYSPGLFALEVAQSLPLVQVGQLEVSISREQPRVEGKVQIISSILGESIVSVKSKLEVVSEIRLRETYESTTLPFNGNTIELPKPLQYSRELYVTYLDEDILIVRDGSGIPELLVRKEKSFTRNWGTEPTSVDDVLAPGIEE